LAAGTGGPSGVRARLVGGYRHPWPWVVRRRELSCRRNSRGNRGDLRRTTRPALARAIAAPHRLRSSLRHWVRECATIRL